MSYWWVNQNQTFRAEVRGSFHGSWDTTWVMVPFYRPLTVAFHAVRFELLGLDARRHHALSLTLFACCAALVGWLALRITGRLRPGINATVLYASHPAMPYSLVAWVTNQMHLIETVTVLLALAWWHVVRGRSVAWWLPLLGLGAAAFLIKEDGIMLIPCVVVAHWINRRINEPNLEENVLPTRGRAQLVLTKDADHSIRRMLLRKV